MQEEDLDEEPQGTEVTTSHEPPSDYEVGTARPTQEAQTAVLSDLHNEGPLETEISSENSFTREAMDAGYMLVEAIHDVAEEELSAGWGWFGTGSPEEPTAATSTITTTTPATATKPVKRRRKKQRKRRGKKKKKSVWKPSPGVGGHVEWTHFVAKLNSAPS